MKVKFIERMWSHDDLEHGETFNEPSVKEVNISSIEDIAKAMQDYCYTSVNPVLPGKNFWLYSESETVDYQTSDVVERSMHLINPTPYNLKLWYKAHLLTYKQRMGRP